MKLFYCGLEPYNERYTLQLEKWNTVVFDRRNIDYQVVAGKTIDSSKSIQTGQVLDAHGRSYYALSQMMELVQMMKQGDITGDDIIFFEDMFQPGIESLPYIMDQIPKADRPKVWVRCLAQSIDPDDFIHVWDMQKWMGSFEKLVNEFVTGILASNEEMIANMKIAGWTAPLYNISGGAFNADEVRSRVDSIPTFESRPKTVCFASRWDQEKQPDFYMDIAEAYYKIDPTVEFKVLSGGALRSNDQKYVNRAISLEKQGKLTINQNLPKNEYYSILANARVLMNNSLQDWTSVTVGEADALGANVLFPAYRSFPEIFNNDCTRLYIPWSQDDAIAKLTTLLAAPSPKIGEISNWTSGTVDRQIDIMTGFGQEWNRDSKTYRNFVAEQKYKESK